MVRWRTAPQRGRPRACKTVGNYTSGSVGSSGVGGNLRHSPALARLSCRSTNMARSIAVVALALLLTLACASNATPPPSSPIPQATPRSASVVQATESTPPAANAPILSPTATPLPPTLTEAPIDTFWRGIDHFGYDGSDEQILDACLIHERYGWLEKDSVFPRLDRRTTMETWADGRVFTSNGRSSRYIADAWGIFGLLTGVFPDGEARRQFCRDFR